MELEKVKNLYIKLRDLICELGSDESEIEEELTFRFYCPDPGFEYAISLYLDLGLEINSELGNKICSLIVSKEGPELIDGGVNLGRQKLYVEGITDFRIVSSFCSALITHEFEYNGIDLIYNKSIQIEEENVELSPDERENADKVVSSHLLSLKIWPATENFIVQEILDGIPSVFYILGKENIEAYGDKIQEIMEVVFLIQRECFFL